MSGPQSAPVRPRLRVAIATVVTLTAAVLVSACAGRDQPAVQAPAAASASGSSSAVPLGEHGDRSLSARAVVAALALRGFLVPNLMDVTDQICPTAGCDHSLVTDTLRITSFASQEAAAQYAHEHGVRNWHNIVIAFPPTMPAGEQDKYWSAIATTFP